MSLGMGELVLILLIAFVVVGPKDLPKIARTIAKGIRQVKRLYADVKQDLDLESEIKEIEQAADLSSTLKGEAEDMARIREEIRRIQQTKLL
ncbi:MAG: Sec-independent protein translocase protein TatB [Eubacteriales bacterium]|nr:Sec-independent protein translocase protein TatB [Eubacteriales bacterium]